MYFIAEEKCVSKLILRFFYFLKFEQRSNVCNVIFIGFFEKRFNEFYFRLERSEQVHFYYIFCSGIDSNMNCMYDI